MQYGKKRKYDELMEDLRAQILGGTIKPGEKLLSENRLAADYQVSRQTVRKALAILEEEGFVYAEHGRGTFCSKLLRSAKPSRNIAVVMTYLSDYIFPRVIQGIDQVLTDEGYALPGGAFAEGHRRIDHRAEQEPYFLQAYESVRAVGSKGDSVCLHTGVLRADGGQAAYSAG